MVLLLLTLITFLLITAPKNNDSMVYTEEITEFVNEM